MRRAHDIGRDEALAEIDADAPHRAMCEQLPLEALPSGGRREVSFAWDHVTGRARILGTDRDYSTVTATEYCGTADVIGAVDGVGIVIDWKSGRYVCDPEQASQLRFLALALATVNGFDEVRASFVYLREDGRFYRDETTFDGFDLAALSLKLQALPARIATEQAKVDGGGVPDVNNGPWCRFCPAAPACPAKVALARSFGGELVTIRERVAALTPNEAGKVYARALEYRDLVDNVLSNLRDVARVTPLELPDGRVLQETSVKIATKVDGDVAERVLMEMYGPEAAHEAVVLEKSTTLTAIEDALRKRAQPGQLATMKRETLAVIRSRGGLREGSTVQVRPVKKGA